jgi:hypothetical protein
MQRSFGALLSAAAFGLFACSHKPDDAPVPASGTTTSMFRLDLLGSGTSVLDVASVRTVEVADGARAPIALTADLMVVSRAGDAVVDAAPLHFPKTGSGLSDNGPRWFSLDKSVATVFVTSRPDVDRIEIVDPKGNVVRTLSGDALHPSSTALHIQTEPQIGGDIEPIRGVPVLGPSDAHYLSQWVSRLYEPTPKQRDAISRALQKLRFAGMNSLLAIGIGDMAGTEAGDKAFETGGWVILSKDEVFGGATSADFLTYALAHETAHAFTEACEVTPDPETWPSYLTDYVQKVLTENRLRMGLAGAWATLQRQSGTDYAGANYKGVADGDLVKGAFATQYGASSALEDIAEYVASTLVPQLTSMPTHMGHVCSEFASSPTSPFPRRLAYQYAKLLFLQHVGLLDKTDVDTCTNGVVLVDQPGIWMTDTVVFSQDTKSGFIQEDGREKFVILGTNPADGERMSIDVIADGHVAIGLHRLDPASTLWSGVHFPPNVVLFSKANGAGFESDLGLVFIASQSDTEVTGAMFGLATVNAIGIDTGDFGYVPFRVLK